MAFLDCLRDGIRFPPHTLHLSFRMHGSKRGNPIGPGMNNLRSAINGVVIDQDYFQITSVMQCGEAPQARVQILFFISGGNKY